MAWSNLVCAKLTQNPSHQQWHEWIAPDIGYTEPCPGLPHRAGQRRRLTLSRLDAAPKLIHSSHDGPMNDVVHGHCDHRFGKVADARADEIAKGEELGASIALDIDGELVVDTGAVTLTARRLCRGGRTQSSTSSPAQRHSPPSPR